jgi:ABC-2 type transport system permease protein
MAVFKRTFTAYQGPLTDQRFRFAILTRYAFRSLFESKMTTTLLTACIFPHVVALAAIYVRNNLDALSAALPGLPVKQALAFLSIDGTFFARLLTVEGWFTFIAIAMIGPTLVAPDLANNALAIYLSRPFSKREYVAGKFATLAALASVMTWIPAVLLLLVQTSLAGTEWFMSHKRVLLGIVLGSWIWILTVSLIALAISAWVRWKPVAIASLFGVYFIGPSFGEAVNRVFDLDPRWGTLVNMRVTMAMIWEWLLTGESVYMGNGGTQGIPAWTGLASMLTVCALSLLLLSRKIRASEVVRG